MNAAIPPADAESLRKRYQERLAGYERGAERWKRRTHVLFTIGVMTTVALSFVGIVGTIMQAGGSVVPRVWMVLPTILGATGLVCILVDIVIDPRMRWMTYRRAVHRLWRLAAFGRAGLGAAGEPCEHGSAEWLASLETGIRDIERGVNNSKRGWLEVGPAENSPGPRAALESMLARLTLDWSLPEAAAARPAGRHFPEAGPWPQIETADAYLAGRVGPQINWFLEKAKLNRSRYLLLTGLIAAIYIAMGSYFYLRGRVFWLSVACSTLVMSINMLIGFLNCRPLWEQYRDTARELLAIERRFIGQTAGDAPPHETERLRRLVDEVEDVLESEFYFWHAIHEQARPADLVRRASDGPDREHG